MSKMNRHADNHKAEENLIPSKLWGSNVAIEAEFIERNLLDIKDKIAPCKPKIIGVTKYYGIDAIVNGYKAGLRDFGESRIQDAVQKIESLPEQIRRESTFHLIGHLQTNKVEKAVEYFDVIHSVDSLKLARKISEVACQLNKREKILLQVNVAEESQKYGFEISGLSEVFEDILKLDSVDVIGLMCMAEFGADESTLRKTFGKLRQLRESLEVSFDVRLPELSMGMSDDYLIAVEEGSTMVRIGRKLFK
ncbi:MAG: YggS family pyridoxal phosphate-dependent enzyme [Cyanobacteria bacterium SIG28]|nr:YggS family pyridoxal phosphate-dependent enzyme [Cyanobacteria bacterium SIG28]